MCLIWALSGWGSRLYSLVGGIAPCSGDNYTVYCLPWGAHWTLMNVHHTLRLSIYSYTTSGEKNNVYVCCYRLVMHWLKLSNELLKKYVYLNKVILVSNQLSNNQWMRSWHCLFITAVLMVSDDSSTATATGFVSLEPPLVETHEIALT